VGETRRRNKQAWRRYIIDRCELPSEHPEGELVSIARYYGVGLEDLTGIPGSTYLNLLIEGWEPRDGESLWHVEAARRERESWVALGWRPLDWSGLEVPRV
jgi:hypothetical protein